MTGLYVASTLVTLIQYLRARERRLLPLLALFLLMAAAHARESWDPWRDRLEVLAIAAGLSLLPLLSGTARPGADRP
jgi:hypothetical protein